jgi:general secretion pathway protein I
MRRTRNAQHGFTLVEMIVATLLLAIGVVGAMIALSSSVRANYAAERLQTAALLAQRKLTEIELQPDSLTGGDQQGDFGSQYPEFHWRESVESTDYPDLYRVTVTVQWDLKGVSPREQAYVTYLRNPQNTQNQNGSSPSSSTGTAGAGATGGQ